MNADGSDTGGGSTDVFEALVEVLRDLRHAVDPVESIRPLSIAEAARALRCRRSEVEKLIENGAMPYIKRNGRRYVLPGDVSRWLRNESEREATVRSKKDRRKARKAYINIEDIDPALREFFE